jgi:hypothetical protein
MRLEESRVGFREAHNRIERLGSRQGVAADALIGVDNLLFSNAPEYAREGRCLVGLGPLIRTLNLLSVLFLKEVNDLSSIPQWPQRVLNLLHTQRPLHYRPSPVPLSLAVRSLKIVPPHHASLGQHGISGHKVHSCCAFELSTTSVTIHPMFLWNKS